MGNYSMPRYFQNMPVVGKPVRANAENVAELKAIEEEIHAQIVKGLENGRASSPPCSGCPCWWTPAPGAP